MFEDLTICLSTSAFLPQRLALPPVQQTVLKAARVHNDLKFTGIECAVVLACSVVGGVRTEFHVG